MREKLSLRLHDDSCTLVRVHHHQIDVADDLFKVYKQAAIVCMQEAITVHFVTSTLFLEWVLAFWFF